MEIIGFANGISGLLLFEDALLMDYLLDRLESLSNRFDRYPN